ncbi:hypothetical protein [Leptolyngbya sp. AN03gr2]
MIDKHDIDIKVRETSSNWQGETVPVHSESELDKEILGVIATEILPNTKN